MSYKTSEIKLLIFKLSRHFLLKHKISSLGTKIEIELRLKYIKIIKLSLNASEKIHS